MALFSTTKLAARTVPLALIFSCITGGCAAAQLPDESTEQSTIAEYVQPHIVSLSPEKASTIYFELRNQTPFDQWEALSEDHALLADDEKEIAYNGFLTQQFQSHVYDMFRKDGYTSIKAEAIAYGYARMAYPLHGFDISPEMEMFGHTSGFIPGLNHLYNSRTPSVIHSLRMSEFVDHHTAIGAICMAAIPEATHAAVPIFASSLRVQPETLEGLSQSYDHWFARFMHFHELAHCHGMNETQADYFGAIQVLREAQNDNRYDGAKALIEFTSAMRLHRLYNTFVLTGYRDRFQPFALASAIEDFEDGLVEGLSEEQIWALPHYNSEQDASPSREDIERILSPLENFDIRTPVKENYPFPIEPSAG